MKKMLSIILAIALAMLFYACSGNKPTEPPKANKPGVVTSIVGDVTQTSVTCGGIIATTGGAPIIALGVCWSTHEMPTITDSKTTDTTGTGSDTFNSKVTGLSASTGYFIRAYATNSAGTGYGDQLSFTTLAIQAPTVTTNPVTAIGQKTATCGGQISFDGGTPVTARGVCWSRNPDPTLADNKTSDGAGTGNFTSTITGLNPSTPYYVRAYATNSTGTGYGNTLSFTTAIGTPDSTGTVTDIDGNVYKTVKIGNQWWMAENLRVTHYRNGDAIPNVTVPYEWDNTPYGAYCNYNNDISNVPTYGRLYNGHAAFDSRNIAPVGWHVPGGADDAEWQQLVTYLAGNLVAGGKLKEAGTAHWNSPNVGATNETGFTALPGGCRLANDPTGNASFEFMGASVFFWSSSMYFSNAWDLFIGYESGAVSLDHLDKNYGFSIRCVKD